MAFNRIKLAQIFGTNDTEIPGDKVIDFEESFLFLQAFGNAPLDVL